MKKILDYIDQHEPEFIRCRRQFHQIPEIGMKEYETSSRIANYLEEWGFAVNKIGETGVTGLLKSNNPDNSENTIAIRADIDALPLTEESGLDFRSTNEGVMHACGHDSHIAIALGAARVISHFQGKLNINVKFIFQPAEETLEGAESIIKGGALKNPEVNAIIGLHNWPDLETGSIAVKEGPVMAAVDKFEIEIIGRGGHGALPQQTIDPIVLGSEIVNSIQKIISRNLDPQKAAVITIGSFTAGTAFNIIPEKAKLLGTVRTFDHEIRRYIPRRMEEIISGITEGSGANYNFNYMKGIPATINDKKLTANIKEIMKNILGSEKIIDDIKPSMGGEDFALYQREIPGVFFWLGSKNPEKDTYPIHHPRYTIDEDMLKTGITAFCSIIFSYK